MKLWKTIRSFLNGDDDEKYGTWSVFDPYRTRSVSDVTVNGLTALSNPAIYAGTKMIAETIAGLQKRIIIETQDGVIETEKKGSAYEAINVAPNNFQTPYQFFLQLVTNYIVYGNALIIPIYGARQTIKALTVVPPEKYTIYKSEKKDALFPHFYRVEMMGMKDIYLPDEVGHIKNISYDGIRGLSILELLKDPIGTTIAAQQFEGSFFANSAIMAGYLEFPQKMNEAQVEEIQRQWKKRYSGRLNAGKIPVLSGGSEYKPISSPMRDNMLEELKRFGVEDMSRVIGIPIHKLNHLDRMSFSNIEVMEHNYVTNTILPIVKQLEGELDKLFFTSRERLTRRVNFNIDSLLRGDSKARAEYYAKMVSIEAMSPNEVRKLEKMNPYEGGDEFRNPNINMKTKTNADNEEGDNE